MKSKCSNSKRTPRCFRDDPAGNRDYEALAFPFNKNGKTKNQKTPLSLLLSLSLFFSRSLDSVKKHVMEQSRDEDAMEVNEVEGESS